MGYIVQSGGRFSLQYLDGDLIAEIKVDRAEVTGLFPNSMTIVKGGVSKIPNDKERNLILSRIINALGFWGMKYEIYHE